MKEYQIQILGNSETKKLGNRKCNICSIWGVVEAGNRAKDGERVVEKDKVDSRIAEFNRILSS